MSTPAALAVLQNGSGAFFCKFQDQIFKVLQPNLIPDEACVVDVVNEEDAVIVVGEVDGEIRKGEMKLSSGVQHPLKSIRCSVISSSLVVPSPRFQVI